MHQHDKMSFINQSFKYDLTKQIQLLNFPSYRLSCQIDSFPSSPFNLFVVVSLRLVFFSRCIYLETFLVRTSPNNHHANQRTIGEIWWNLIYFCHHRIQQLSCTRVYGKKYGHNVLKLAFINIHQWWYVKTRSWCDTD